MIQILLVFLFTIEGYLSVVISSYSVTGIFRMIKPVLYRYIRIHILVNTQPHAYSRYFGNSGQLLGKSFEYLIIRISVFKIEIEIVRIRSASYAYPFAKHSRNHISYLLQNAVTCFSPEHFIEHMKMLYIQNNGIHLTAMSAAVYLPDIFLEEFTGIQIRQIILLSTSDDALVLIQLYDSLASGKDHFRHIIGLCDKIIRTHFDAADFSRLLRCHYYHRNIGNRFFGFDLLKQFKPIHFRHQQIKQDQRVARQPLMKHIVGLSSVLGIRYFVLCSEYIPQYFSVDFFIIHHKDASFRSSLISEITHLKLPPSFLESHAD